MKIELMNLIENNKISIVHSDIDKTFYIVCDHKEDYDNIHMNIEELYLLGEHIKFDMDKYNSSTFPLIDSILNSKKYVILLFMDELFGGF